MVPTVRDLQFMWEEMPQQVLDEQQQKMRTSLRAALTNWARGSGEAADYTDNLPSQCMHPVGHWYEIPNLLRNGTLHRLLKEQPKVEYLMLHNIDTLGANLDAGVWGNTFSRARICRLRSSRVGWKIEVVDWHEWMVEFVWSKDSPCRTKKTNSHCRTTTH